MSDISDVIDQITGEALGAPLKALEFRKGSRTWRRRVDSAVQVVQVQASRTNRGPDGRFWLNAGVYFPTLSVRIGDFAPTDLPAESDCQVRTRPMPPGKSWWEVRAAGVRVPGEDEAGSFLGSLFSWFDRRADQREPARKALVAAKLRESLELYAIPWLQRMTDLRVARDELSRTGPAKWAAAASLELGEPEEAVRLLRRALAEKSGGAEELIQWGQTNGISL